MRTRWNIELLRAPDGVVGGGAAPAAGADGGTGANALLTPAAGGAPVVGAAPVVGGATPAPAADLWYKDLPAEQHPVIAAKGWKGPGEVLESYVNLEKLLGADKAGRTVVVPNEKSTPEERAAFNLKMGVPEQATGYEFKIPDGANADLAKAAAGWMHEAGVPKGAGEKIVSNYLAAEAAMMQQFHADSAKQMTELQVEWAQGFEKNAELARRGAKEFGLPVDALNKLERAIGTSAMMKMFAKMGGTIAEGATPPGPGQTAGGGTATFKLTAEQAKANIAAKQADSEFQARLLSPNQGIRKPALEEWERLHKALEPG